MYSRTETDYVSHFFRLFERSSLEEKESKKSATKRPGSVRELPSDARPPPNGRGQT